MDTVLIPYLLRIPQSVHRKALYVIGVTGVICSLSVIFETIEKMAKSQTPTWSVLRLMGPQIWMPIKAREEYNIAILLMIFSMLYGAACFLMVYGAWTARKNLSLSWRLCEAVVLVYQGLAAILTRNFFTTQDVWILGADTVIGMCAVLYISLTEKILQQQTAYTIIIDTEPSGEIRDAHEELANSARRSLGSPTTSTPPIVEQPAAEIALTSSKQSPSMVSQKPYSDEPSTSTGIRHQPTTMSNQTHEERTVVHTTPSDASANISDNTEETPMY